VSILLDAGPSLNFLAVGQQNILVQLAASRSLQLAAPEQVDREVHGKASSDARFRRTGAAATWKKLTSSGRVHLLDDSLTSTDFRDAVARISGMPATDRMRQRKSLGEILVLAHASVCVLQGHDVFVLMDDGDGRARAHRERQWLQRQSAPGTLRLWGTRQVLEQVGTAQPQWIAGNQGWRSVYQRMRTFDDGLAPL
jgi:hypothetical protein